MWFVHSLVGKIIYLLFYPFQNLSPWFSMFLISLITAVVMLIVFRYTSNQEGIRRTKNKIKAHLLELRLFKESFSLSLKAQLSILKYNLRYAGYSLKPLLVMIIPLVLILTQLNLWFGYRPFYPGEKAMVKVHFKKGTDMSRINLTLVPGNSFSIQSSPLRIPSEEEINWELRIEERGLYTLLFRVDEYQVSKTLLAGGRRTQKVSPARVGRNFFDLLLNPGEKPFQKEIPLKYIDIKYPNQKMNFFGLKLHWLIVYFVLSIAFGFALKGVLGVEI